MYKDKELDYLENEMEREFENLSAEKLTQLNRLSNNKFTVISDPLLCEIILATSAEDFYIISSCSWYSFYQRLSDFYTGYLEGLLISKGVNL